MWLEWQVPPQLLESRWIQEGVNRHLPIITSTNWHQVQNYANRSKSALSVCILLVSLWQRRRHSRLPRTYCRKMSPLCLHILGTSKWENIKPWTSTVEKCFAPKYFSLDPISLGCLLCTQWSVTQDTVLERGLDQYCFNRKSASGRNKGTQLNLANISQGQISLNWTKWSFLFFVLYPVDVFITLCSCKDLEGISGHYS